MTREQLLDAILKGVAGRSEEELLKAMSDDQLQIAVQSAASLFKSLRDEAVRRGLWQTFITKVKV